MSNMGTENMGTENPIKVPFQAGDPFGKQPARPVRIFSEILKGASIESVYKVERLSFFRHSPNAFGIAGMTNDCSLLTCQGGTVGAGPPRT